MKKQNLVMLVALASSLVLAGQSFARPRVLEADVPFAFEVGSKRLPAGHYQIESVTTGAATLEVIRQGNGDARTTISTMAVEPGVANAQPQLIFHRYSNTFFLYQIRDGAGKARQLFESKQEKEAAVREAASKVVLAAR